MMGELVQFAASLAAVTLLVAVVHLAGFSRPARLADEQEARELARLAPGGFVAQRIALDQNGHGAIIADAAGRLLLLRAHGGQFVPESVERADISAEGGKLLIRHGGQITSLCLGVEAARWPDAALAI
jgi:hypothetical protein